ncbi:MAG: ABATE domain-containing protein [Acidobacteriia bacterium]|nr:ABATE domain-containing protein [Terriglobia bacterium]
MRKTLTTKNSKWRDGFLFLGNQLTLDFLNTSPVQDGEAVELLLDFGALVRWFHASGLLDCRANCNLPRE